VSHWYKPRKLVSASRLRLKYNVRMTSGPNDPNWSRLLALSVHEFRTPITVVAGYIRMLLKDKAGALTDQQRRLLEEAEKSCARLSGLVAEMSDLANLEAGNAPFNRSAVDLKALLAEAIDALPPAPDREVRVTMAASPDPASVDGDPARLRGAFAALINATRRELVTSDELFVRERRAEHDGRAAAWIAIGDGTRIDALEGADRSALTTFDEWRGGSGLSLAIARRVIEAHGGRVWSPVTDSKGGAVAVLPLA
jgi:signal transduction histidine kinase